MTRSLMFFIVETRLDNTFSIIVVACFTKNPSYAYRKAIKTIFRYSRRLMDCNITYSNDGKNLSIENYLASDWAGDKESQSLMSGFIFILNGSSIS